MKKPYWVEIDKSGCETCQHGRTHLVIGPDDVALATSYVDIEDAEDIASDLNDAYEKGMEAYNKVSELQPVMVEWVKSRLGPEAMETRERAMRFMEEALELAQAAGLAFSDVAHIVSHVYRKPAGSVGQEVGGVYTTLVTLAQSCDVDTLIAALMEKDRIHSLPPEKFQKRQMLNAELGIGKPIELAPHE